MLVAQRGVRHAVVHAVGVLFQIAAVGAAELLVQQRADDRRGDELDGGLFLVEAIVDGK